MIEITNYEVNGWQSAIRGMRNPMNSWAKSDSQFDVHAAVPVVFGKNDSELMWKLAQNGAVHAKYRRMITVYADIVAPLYWWKEFDTYKVGTVANSCSTMHKIQEKEFTIDDFSHEHLYTLSDIDWGQGDPTYWLSYTVSMLNEYRMKYLSEKEKQDWWQLIQMLPSSYNQKRTVMLNYEVLVNMYHSRRAHKLDEWIDFCEWIRTLPFSDLMTAKEGCNDDD